MFGNKYIHTLVRHIAVVGARGAQLGASLDSDGHRHVWRLRVATRHKTVRRGVKNAATKAHEFLLNNAPNAEETKASFLGCGGEWFVGRGSRFEFFFFF